MSSKRLLIVSSTFPDFKAGGVPRYVEGRRRYLARRLDVLIAARGLANGQAERASLGTLSGPVGLLIAWVRLIWLVLRWRPTFIEVHNIPVGLPTLLLLSIRYIFHGPAGLEAQAQGFPRWRVGFATALERLCLRRASSLHCVSPYFMRLLRDRVLPPASHANARRVIKPRLEYDAPLRPIEEQSRATLLVCRRLVPRTGVDLAIEAFSRLAGDASLPPSRLLVIGDGPQRAALEQLAASLPMGRCSVEFAGSVPDEVRDAAYAQATVQVVPTKSFEGFGLVVVEAALFGCPSIVTSVDALPWVISELGGIGAVVEPAATALTDAMRLALLQPMPISLRQQLQRRAAHRFGVARRPAALSVS